jgi:hypothetical protein
LEDVGPPREARFHPLRPRKKPGAPEASRAAGRTVISNAAFRSDSRASRRRNGR